MPIEPSSQACLLDEATAMSKVMLHWARGLSWRKAVRDHYCLSFGVTRAEFFFSSFFFLQQQCFNCSFFIRCIGNLTKVRML